MTIFEQVRMHGVLLNPQNLNLEAYQFVLFETVELGSKICLN